MDRKPCFAMKVGVRAALINGERVKTDLAPIMADGNVYLPKKYLPKACTPYSYRLFGDDEYVGIDPIDGMYVKYDTMGLIMLDTDEAITEIDRKTDMAYMLGVMGDFIFDVERVKIDKMQYAPATEEERCGFRRVGAELASKLRSNINGHPYLFANKERFARLRELYSTDENPKVREYLTRLVSAAERTASEEQYHLTEDGGALKTPIVDTHAESGGYDVGGRTSVAESNAGNAMRLAFAYQLTGKESFARLAYYICEGAGRFTHWGPGHFLNCAGAAGFMAITYDWLYEDWARMGLDVSVIRRAIYDKGIHQGYNSVIFDCCDHPSPKQGTGWRFKNKPDNWNAVCNSGLIIANLAILGDGADGYIDGRMLSEAEELLGANLVSLTQEGLVLNQYAPDGSYVESASYWSYGTNSLFRAIGALHSALGTDLGISASWGLDRTCYYAINSESADYVGWNYHDGSLGSQDTSMFNLFATVSGDSSLYALRSSQLARGKSVTMFDMLYHPAVLGVSEPALDNIPLDYLMEGIDALTVRDGWEAGSLYAGIIGGYNPSGGSHCQLDSGAFAYHNKGVLWLTDLGSDYYNTYHYFSNYALYRRNAEGHNVISLKSLPYGQTMDSTSRIIDTAQSDSATYAIIDQTPIYGADRVRCAKRGMLLTNNRRTTVIQDEIDFISPEEAYWIGHYKSADITVELSEDGRVATMTHKEGARIRVTLLCDGHRFEIMSCYDFLLDGTAGFEGEYSREEYSRLVVRFNDTSVRCAAVIEEEGVSGYTDMLPMDKWHELVK